MKNKSGQFKKKILAASISSCVLASLGVQAQDGPTAVEEVQVMGIRASMQSSMDTKRNASGVVDAITAEDIGKFPDTNLAESLQRITGVSISRTNGEGAEVTVRGFGAEYNLITLNGRHMPAASVYGGGSGAGGTNGSSNRSFDFSNLASESVSSVEVYKTSKANIATGGMGATINIGTARPLDNPGLNASFGVKGVHDTTNREGHDITPEFSGILSVTDSDEVFGASLSASFQKRHSGNSGVAENAWNIGYWDADDLTNNLYSFTDDAVIIDPPADGQLYGRPNDLRYSFSDQKRERTNAQLTMQFAPSESFVATLDYTFAENDVFERRGESTSWLANGTSIDRVVFSDDPVATPLLIHETAGPRDQGYEQQLRQQTNTLSSYGMNLDFQITDNFTFVIDAHDSSMESLPTGPGRSGEIAVSMGAPSQVSHTLVFNNDMPLYNWVADDSTRGDGDGQFSLGDLGSQVVRVFYNAQKTDIAQVKMDGALEFDNGRFDFGYESREMQTSQQSSQRYMGMGDWGIANVGDIPAGLMELYNLSSFDDYNTAGSSQVGVRGNAEFIANHLVNSYRTDGNGYKLEYEPNFNNDNTVDETTEAYYFQVSLEGELGGMPTSLVTGIRYESTDLISSSLVQVPVGLLWQDNNDFQTDYGSGSGDFQPFLVTNSYNNMLPSMDLSFDITDDLKGRLSYGKTIARASYGQLQSAISGFGSGGGSTYNGAVREADAGNPLLVPLESDNTDVALEWYYGDASFASFNLFEKRVSNFIGDEKIEETHFTMYDQTSGPRAEAAAAALDAAGMPIDDTTLFVMMAIQTQTGDAANIWVEQDYVDAFNDADSSVREVFQQDVATALDIAVDPSADPEAVWLTNKPVNSKEAKLYGAELAVQHFFGDSGFGAQANYTVVRGDVAYDNLGDPAVTQFALLGLSDSANLVAVYDKDGIQARVAYNWRDEYLRNANTNSSRNPVYVESHWQIDVNVSYDISDQISVFAEGLNITGENHREHQRTASMIQYLEDLGARYQFGARYTF